MVGLVRKNQVGQKGMRQTGTGTLNFFNLLIRSGYRQAEFTGLAGNDLRPRCVSYSLAFGVHGQAAPPSSVFARNRARAFSRSSCVSTPGAEAVAAAITMMR